jgi:predicted GIY-YIG superfamily endonuclease
MADRYWYVYMLCSDSDPGRYHVGMTSDLHTRLDSHNAGRICHTRKFRPGRVEAAVAFRSRPKAVAFEEYLKSHSDRAFAKSHF